MKPALKTLLFAAPLLLFSGRIEASSNEKSTQAPAAVISPYTYWCTTPGNCHPERGRFYNPAGVKVGNNYYIYVQGGAYVNVTTGPGSECTAVGEEILLFKAPWTAQGLRSPFTYVKTITPCRTDVPDVHYELGSVFQSSTDGKYKILVDETENGASVGNGNFKRILLGSSTDGLTWTWSPFLQQSTVGSVTYSFLESTLVQATANTNWWGMYLWGTTGSENLMVGQIRVIQDAMNPRGFVAYLLASDGTWKPVNDDGTVNFDPKGLWSVFASDGGSATAIILNNGAWESWGSLGPGTATAGCNDGDIYDSTLIYRTVTQTGLPGPLQTVTSSVRPMPTINSSGRLYPFRLNDMNGAKLLYSASTDRMCTEGRLSGWKGMEVVLTEVDN